MERKSISLLGLALVSVLVSSCSDAQKTRSWSATQARRPLLLEHDFGDILQGQVVRHEFVVFPDANDIRIEGIKSSCSCTVVGVVVGSDGEFRAYESGSPVAVGEELHFNGELDSSEKRGRVSESVFVKFSGQKEPTVLRFKASIIPLLVSDPPSLDLGRITVGESGTITARIESPLVEQMALRLEDLASPPPGWNATLLPEDPLDKAGFSSSWLLTVTCTGEPAEVRKRAYPLALTCYKWSGRKRPELHDVKEEFTQRMLAFSEVLPDVFADPEYLSVGLLAPNTQIERTFVLKSGQADFVVDESAVTLEGVPPSVCDVTWRMNARADGGQECVVSIRTSGGGEGIATLRCEFHIPYTSGGRGGELVVPLIGLVGASQ